MEILRKEIRTGVLVVVTLVVLIVVVVTVGAPGVFKKVNTYRIYFDNAAGVKLGGQVLLAGRTVGTVTELHSPVPLEQRPKNHQNYEALIVVQMERSAKVYQHVSVRMQQLSMLGELTIDFAQGDPNSGVAADGTAFIGERAPDLSESLRKTMETLKPVALEATKTLQELQQTAANLRRLTAQGSEFDTAVGDFRQLGDNLVDMTNYGSPLRNSLDDFSRISGDLKKITDDLANNDRVKLTLEDFQATAQKFSESGDALTRAIGNINRTVNELRPELMQTTVNTREATDTLKRQPWRLLWPTTKKYSGENPKPGPTPRGR